MEPRGWHRRGYLPHCDCPSTPQAVTFRLNDALPASVVERWKRDLERETTLGRLSVEETVKLLRNRIQRFEDLGHGSCLLGHSQHAAAVQEQLLSRHGTTYRLLEWCIMPNHVHVLIKALPGKALGEIVRGWKGSSSRGIQQQHGTKGRLWMPDYHDRLIRDEDHLADCRAYIRQNPVKAGLCGRPLDWSFSSAGVNWNPDDAG